MKRKIDTFWYWFLVIVSFVICFMFSSAINAKAEILNGEITYNEGQELIDGNRTITISKQSKYKIVEVYDTTYKIYLNCDLSGTVLTCSEYTMIGDYNSYTGKTSKTNEFSIINGKLISHIQTGYFYSIKKASSGYTQADLENARNEGYEEGFEAGKNSVDITTDNLAYAEQYLRDKLAHEEIYDVETVSALIQYYNQMLVAMENGWNADLEFLNNILAFTENEIIKIYDGTLNFVMTPEQKNQYYQELIMQQLELLISIVQEDSYNEGYQEGQASIDITSDNEAYAEQVIQDKLDKNQLFDAEYVFNVIQNAEDKFYAEGFEDGKNSVDITSNDSQVIQDYITNNNYHTNTDYLNYGNQKYQEGQNSIDITSNDAQVIQEYITLNKMKTEEDYLYYGAEQRREGYFSSYNDFENKYNQVYSDNNYMTGAGYFCETYTSGAYSCSEAYKGYLNDLNNVAVNSVDITVNDAEVYSEAFLDGKAQGYDKAVSDGKSLGTFIPNLLGGFGSFFLTILNIDILGFNLLSIFGIAITIGIIILILKFMRG